MAVYGYHRTSTRDQHLDRGIHEIQVFCKEHDLELENIFTDQQTGKNFNRPRYMVLVEDVLREGDVLLVTELDRLGRNKRDTMERFCLNQWSSHHSTFSTLRFGPRSAEVHWTSCALSARFHTFVRFHGSHHLKAL